MKLRLLDVSDQELEELERTGKPRQFMTLRSPAIGTVLEKNVLEHEYITQQRDLYIVADLSTVWVQAKVYEYELPHIELGKPVTVTIAALPGASSRGKWSSSNRPSKRPHEQSRCGSSCRTRRGCSNPACSPTSSSRTIWAKGCWCRMSAVIRTGERDLAFREAPKNRFVPVEIQIGEVKFGDRFQVLKGLQEGDRVVTSANFLIDSESRLREGGGGMPGMPGMDMGGMKGKEGQGDVEGMKAMDHSRMKH